MALSAAPPTVLAVAVTSSEWTHAFFQRITIDGLGDQSGYVIPLGPGEQARSIAWNNVDQIRIRFSEDVRVDRSDLHVSGVVNPSYVASGFHYDPQTDWATWTFAQPFGVDRLMLDLDADGADAVRDLQGNHLDGEWVNGAWASESGDGLAGGDFEFTLNVLPGDMAGEAIVGLGSLMSVEYLLDFEWFESDYEAYFDPDGNGVIDLEDWNDVYERLGEEIPLGTPVGVSNDAPRTTHFQGPVEVWSTVNDYSVSLWDVFDDQETLDNQLTYTVQSVGDPSAFDSYSINPATGQLVFNVASPANGASTSPGSTHFVVRATDSAGQSVESKLTIDLYPEGARPTITASATQGLGGVWTIYGWITHPDFTNLDDFNALIWGPFSGYVSAAVDGYFIYSAIFTPDLYGEYLISTIHPQTGVSSNYVSVVIGW
ncbi:MAG: hypothetical protein ACRCT8_15795 [Lacipirellulaceae bacterium]